MVTVANAQRTWQEWLLAGSLESVQREKVIEYVVHRIKEGARLEDVVGEPYVRRNCSRPEIDELAVDPRLVHAAREQLESAFGSGGLDPSAHS